MSENAELKGRIGVAEATFTMVGYIIGGSIFILPGALAAEAGPGVFIAYLLAALVALFICVASAQIGSAFPMSGGTYVAVSGVISPFWGFMVVWMGVLVIFTSTSALAYGMVDYLTEWFPALADHRLPGAIAAIALFTGVNLLGIRTAVWVQILMVLVFMAVLIVFGVGGLFYSSPDNFRPLFPLGVMTVLQAMIPAFYSYSGFAAIVNLGGEVVNPRRNIPLVLAISLPLITVIYTVVTLAMPGVVNWVDLGAGQSTLSRVASVFLPAGVGAFIGAAAVCAIATSINGLLLTKSRDVYSLALDRVFPDALSRMGPFGEPRGALLAMCAVAILGVSLRRSFVEYASMAVLCVMVIHVLQGVVILLLPRRMPAHFRAAEYRMSPPARLFWGIGLIAVASTFIVLGVAGERVGGVVYLAACGMGAGWYAFRRRQLLQRGVRIEQLLMDHAARVLESGGRAVDGAAKAR